MIGCVSLFFHLLQCTQKEVLKIRVKIISIKGIDRIFTYLKSFPLMNLQLTKNYLWGPAMNLRQREGGGGREKQSDGYKMS